MKEQAAQHGTHVGASSSDDNDAYLLQLNKRKKKQPKKKLILENYDLQKVYELFGDVGPAAVSPSGLPHAEQGLMKHKQKTALFHKPSPPPADLPSKIGCFTPNNFTETSFPSFHNSTNFSSLQQQCPIPQQAVREKLNSKTTNIDSDDNSEEPVNFTENPSFKRRKKKNSSRDCVKNYSDETHEGSSEDHYAKIKDSDFLQKSISTLSNSPSLPPPRLNSTKLPTSLDNPIKTEKIMSQAQTLERGKGSKTKKHKNSSKKNVKNRDLSQFFSRNNSSNDLAPTLDYILQQQQQCIVPTFPRTVPKTMLLPQNFSNKISTNDQQFLQQQQLNCIVPPQHYNITNNNSYPQQQNAFNNQTLLYNGQHQHFGNFATPAVLFSCRSPENMQDERQSKQSSQELTPIYNNDIEPDKQFGNFNNVQENHCVQNPKKIKDRANKNTRNSNKNSTLATASYQLKKRLACRHDWKCASVILTCITLLLLALTCYFISVLNARNNSRGAFIDRTANGEAPFNKSNISSSSSMPYSFGATFKQDLSTNEFKKIAFSLRKTSIVKFSISVSRHSFIGVYGRRGLSPSHVVYDFFRVINGNEFYLQEKHTNLTRSKRKSNQDSYGLKNSEFMEVMAAGVWYVGIYNDSPNKVSVTFKAELKEKKSESCLTDCSLHGECVQGKCRCFPGYVGASCNQTACPSKCTGNGRFHKGICVCNPGWTGTDCHVKAQTCDDKQQNPCGETGMCVEGFCQCQPGFTGPGCSEETCKEPCDKGICDGKECRCFEGWMGSRCDQVACNPKCYTNGRCVNGTCLCKKGWNGRNCNFDGCPNHCGKHGTCLLVQEKVWDCICDENWKGSDCGVPQESVCSNSLDDDKDGLVDCEDSDCCITRECQRHPFCTAEASPEDIRLRSMKFTDTDSFYDRVKFLIEENSVQKVPSDTSPRSSPVFFPTRVSVLRGKVVTPDGSPVIAVKVEVEGVPSLGYTLSRERGLFDMLVNGGGAVTLTFQRKPFKRSSVSVFVPWNRMRVIDDVVMSPFQPPTHDTWENDTLSSKMRFELSGECALVRHDFKNLRPVIYSNSFHKSTFIMDSFKPPLQHSSSNPLVTPFSLQSAIFPETQVVQEAINIPGTKVRLLYQSSDSLDYMSTAMIQLTKKDIPDDLLFVHLKVVVEGIVFKEKFVALSNLKYQYAWNRRNAYNEKVHGVAGVEVSVGYEYENCNHVFWTTIVTSLDAYVMVFSGMGGWKLDLYHSYNFQEGTVYKGDGGVLKIEDKVMKTVLGDGKQRDLNCKNCRPNGKDSWKLLSPVEVVASSDGSLFIGDYNFIRKLSPSRDSLHNILQLSAYDLPYKYHMAVNPTDNSLYLSDYKNFQIIRILQTDQEPKDLFKNYEVVVGSGQQCLPSSSSSSSSFDSSFNSISEKNPSSYFDCRDGYLAKNAKLHHPKAVAIDKDNVMFIADGTSIRYVDKDGIINTLIGNRGTIKHRKPFPCEGYAKPQNVMFYWPVSLAVNPLDNSLHILDDNVVYKMTREGWVQKVAGILEHCYQKNSDYNTNQNVSKRVYYQHKHRHESIDNTEELYSHYYHYDVHKETNGSNIHHTEKEFQLNQAYHISFSPDGVLHIIENNGKNINRVISLDSQGKRTLVAGLEENACDCSEAVRGCDCFDDREHEATSTPLNSPSSTTFTPDGVLYIADTGNKRIRSVSLKAREVNDADQIIVPDGDYTYHFNKFGHHVSTVASWTGILLYNFTHNNQIPVSLESITDHLGNIIEIKQVYGLNYKLIVNDQLTNWIVVNPMGQVEAFKSENKRLTRNFSYSTANQLIHSSEDSNGNIVVYEYNNIGRLTNYILSNGVKKFIKTDLVDGSFLRGGILTEVVNERGDTEEGFIFNQNAVFLFYGGKYQKTVWRNELGLGSSDNMKTRLSLRNYNKNVDKNVFLSGLRAQVENIIDFESIWLIRSDSKMSTKRLMLKDFKAEKNKFYVIDESHQDLSSTLIYIEKNLNEQTTTVFNRNMQRLLSIKYNHLQLPVSIEPIGKIEGIYFTYNNESKNSIENKRHNNLYSVRLTSWKRANLLVSFLYDKEMRVKELRVNNKIYKRFLYNFSGPQPSEVHLASGNRYKLHYDSFSNIRGFVSASGLEFSVHSYVSFGFQRQLFKTPIMTITHNNQSNGFSRNVVSSQSHNNSDNNNKIRKNHYFRDFDFKGRPLSVHFPSGFRRITYHYSRHGNRVSVFHDYTDQLFNFDPHNPAFLKSCGIKEKIFPYFESSTNFEGVGYLIIRHSTRISFSDNNNKIDEEVKEFNERYSKMPVEANYGYEFDSMGRMVRMNSHINGFQLPDQDPIKYSQDKGHSEHYNGFTIDRTSMQREFISDKNVKIVREYDSFRRLSHVSYIFQNHLVFYIEIERDSFTDEVKSWKKKIESNSAKLYENLYDVDGNLVEVLVENQPAWKLAYDKDGFISEVSYHKSVKKIELDERGCVQSVDALKYEYDGDGFLSKKGSQTFEFDSSSKLKRSFQNKAFDVRYYYDALDRLVLRHERLTDDVTYYFYANILKPLMLTHTLQNNNYKRQKRPPNGKYHKSNEDLSADKLVMTEYLYDINDNVISVRRYGENDVKLFYIGIDASASPHVVMDEIGNVLRQVDYDPLGQQLQTEGDDEYIVLGYRGGYYDMCTGMLMFQAGVKVYDPEIGRYVAPDYSGVLDHFSQLLWRPEDFAHLYKMNFKQPSYFSSPHTELSTLTDVNQWLSNFGYDMKSYFPSIEHFTTPFKHFLPASIYPINCMPAHSSLVRSSLHCAFTEQTSEHLNNFLFTQISKLQNTHLFPPTLSFSTVLPIFGKKILLSSVDSDGQAGIVEITALNDANTALSLITSTLLNNSLLVYPHYNAKSKDVHHFIRQYSSGEDDISALRLRPEGVIQGLVVNVKKNPHDKNKAEIKIHGNHTVVHIKFGVSPEEERQRIINHAKSKTLEVAWRLEQQLAFENKSSATKWSQSQRHELLSSGRVSRVTAKYLRDVRIFPELLDDPKNVEFIALEDTEEANLLEL